MNSVFDDEYEMAEAIGLEAGEETTANGSLAPSTSDLQLREEAVESATGALLDYQVWRDALVPRWCRRRLCRLPTKASISNFLIDACRSKGSWRMSIWILP